MSKFYNMLTIEVFGKDFGDLKFAVTFNNNVTSVIAILNTLNVYFGYSDEVAYVLTFADVASPYARPYPHKFAHMDDVKPVTNLFKHRFPSVK